MTDRYTVFGAKALMASAVMFLGLAGWNLATPAAGETMAYVAAKPPASPRLFTAAATTPLPDLPALPTLEPLPPLDTVAINITVPQPKPPTQAKPAAARLSPHRPPAPAPAAAKPAAPDQAIPRSTEYGTRA